MNHIFGIILHVNASFFVYYHRVLYKPSFQSKHPHISFLTLSERVIRHRNLGLFKTFGLFSLIMLNSACVPITRNSWICKRNWKQLLHVFAPEKWPKLFDIPVIFQRWQNNLSIISLDTVSQKCLFFGLQFSLDMNLLVHVTFTLFMLLNS
jgi:hypothetical protein